MAQVNAMAATLRAQRLGALEATTLLRKVMEEIDVAVFAFDGERRLRLVNRAGERLLAQPVGAHHERQRRGAGSGGIPGRRRDADRAAHVSLGRGPLGDSSVACSAKAGLPHQLLVVTDLTRALREEELQAWQRLVRVLGHELNNSLAPIKSIAGSLEIAGPARAVCRTTGRTIRAAACRSSPRAARA